LVGTGFYGKWKTTMGYRIEIYWMLDRRNETYGENLRLVVIYCLLHSAG
jgi:hypothetical protein